MPKKHLPFFLTILALIIFVVGSVMYQERILKQGDIVILETLPIDPRDLFRGEYVILRYVVENDELVRSVVTDNETLSKIYLELQLDSRGVASVARVSTTKPDWGSGLWLPGEVRFGRVRFPMLEQYYVPEGAGLPIERLGTEIHVAVRLHNGKARISHLLDGTLQPIDPSDYLSQ